MLTRIHLIYTCYPHWGQYSGINQFIKYIDPKKFAIDARVVTLGDSNFPVPNLWVRNSLRRLARKIKLSNVLLYELNDLVAECDALRQWSRGRVDLLHYLVGEHSLQYLPSLLRKLHVLKPKPPIVATFHQPPQLLDSLLNINVVRHLDRILVVSPTQVPFFEQYVPAHKIDLILHGIDVEYFRPALLPRERLTFRCLCVGFWMRDYDALLAVAELLQCHPEIEFHVVSNVFKQPSHLGNIHVHMNIDDEALRNIYQQSDVLFMPLTDATANNALLEGIACGLPVITTELSALRAYISEKEAMLILDNHPETFSRAILTLYGNPHLYQKMAHFARERALELSWYNIVRQYESMYLSLAN